MPRLPSQKPAIPSPRPILIGSKKNKTRAIARVLFFCYNIFMEDAFFSWQAPEYEHFPKSTDWYWAMGIIAAALFITAVLFKNFLFAVIVALGTFSVALYGARKPEIINFAFTPRGIQIGKRLFFYEDLESFWVHYDPPHRKEIGLISKKTFMPRFVLPLGNTDPNEARKHLIKFLKEEHHEESLNETISKFLGF